MDKHLREVASVLSHSVEGEVVETLTGSLEVALGGRPASLTGQHLLCGRKRKDL